MQYTCTHVYIQINVPHMYVVAIRVHPLNYLYMHSTCVHAYMYLRYSSSTCGTLRNYDLPPTINGEPQISHKSNATVELLFINRKQLNIHSSLYYTYVVPLLIHDVKIIIIHVMCDIRWYTYVHQIKIFYYLLL